MKPKLVDGKIPAYTECPWRRLCDTDEVNGCYHKGKQHKVSFSCALARGFEMVEGINSKLGDTTNAI